MIFTERQITIRNGKSSINEPVILYRGDYEVSIKLTIMESKFRFKSGVNLVDSEKASFGQLAILAPYGGNVFSEVVECEDGTVTFTLTKEMIDQLEEVGLYSFQIRLFDYYRESRVSIPPVEFGIEVREPVASEDHDNSVNNAIVGYSIAKIADGLNEDVPETFDDNGQYNKTDWETGDRISEKKLNKIEDAIDQINQNEIDLENRATSNYNVLNSIKADKNEIFSMANMGQDIKEAMTGGSVPVVGKNTILSENIIDKQVTNNKIADGAIDGRVISKSSLQSNTASANFYFIPASGVQNYCLITVANNIGDIVSGSTISLSALIKNNDCADFSISAFGIASTTYRDDSDYDNSSLPNLQQYALAANTISRDSSAYLNAKSMSYTKNISESDNLIFAIRFAATTSPTPININVSDIHIKVNDTDVSVTDIYYAGMFETTNGYTGEPVVTYGTPIIIPMSAIEGHEDILTKTDGINGSDINNGTVEYDKISDLAFIKNESYMYDVTMDGWMSWLLFHIHNDCITKKTITLKAYVKTDDNTSIATTYTALGYTYDLYANFNSTIPGYIRVENQLIQYDNNILTISIDTSLISDFPSDAHLIVGVYIHTLDGTSHASLKQIKNIAGDHDKFLYCRPYLQTCTINSEQITSNDKVLISSHNLNDYLSSYNKNDLVGKKISILGDSISTFAGWIPEGNGVYYTGSNCGVTSVDETWWKRVIDDLGLELCVNNAWSGSRMSATGAVGSEGCGDRCISLHTEESDPDIIIIFLGTNDFNMNVGLGEYDGTQEFPTNNKTYREAYAICLNKVLTRYPNARVYVSTFMGGERNGTTGFPEKNDNGEMVKQWNDAIKELADLFGVTVIEMNKCGITYQNASLMYGDYNSTNLGFLHPNALGMKYMAEQVKKTLLYK